VNTSEIRIIGKDNGHCLRQLMSTSACKALCFCPLMYLIVMSKQLHRGLGDCSVLCESSISAATVLLQSSKVVQRSIVSMGSRDFHNQSQLEQEKAV